MISTSVIQHAWSKCLESRRDVSENGLASFCHSGARIVTRTRGSVKVSEVFYCQCCYLDRIPIFQW
jgi:hypothetical protein